MTSSVPHAGTPASPFAVGLLTALGPMVPLLVQIADAPGTFIGPASHISLPVGVAAGLLGAAIFVSGLLLGPRPTAARWIGRVAATCAALGILPAILSDPGLTLAALLCAGALVFGILGEQSSREDPTYRALPADHPRRRSGAVLSSSAVAIAGWLLAGSHRLVESRIALALSLAVFAVACFHTARWVVATLRFRTDRRRWLLLLAVATLGALLSAARPDQAVAWLALQQAIVVGLILTWQRSAAHAITALTERPATALISTFAFLCLGGGLLLMLPPASGQAARLPFLDATFTATSAACVTGLTVLDTPRDFSFFGQACIALLIQVGGLGIMTFSAAGTLLLGQRLGLRAEAAMGDLLGDATRPRLDTALRRVLSLTIAAEALGALVLTLAFWAGGEGLGTAWWRGVFTAISAFCNAGFALQTDNLVPYQEAPVILHTVAALVVVGGLGPSVVAVLPAILRRRFAPLHARVALATSAALLVGGTLFYLMVEWSGGLAHLGVLDRFHNAWFQAVTPRTAGFNALDLTTLHPASQLLTIILMFVGGSPASTAGGIKTTTVALLFLAVLAALRGRGVVTAFGREVDPRSVSQAAVVAALGAAVALGGATLLLLTQPLPAGGLVYETFSALGTVGLSLGITPRLDSIGRIIVIGLMFVGRVGPLTLFLFLSDEVGRRGASLPVEPVNVG